MKRTILMMALSLVAFGAASTAMSQNTLITFDDVASLDFITNGYRGFNWTNFYSLDAVHYNGGISGFGHGVISTNNIASNNGATPADISSTSTFTLGSGYFTAAWNNGLSLEVQGYNGAILLYDQTYVLNTTAPSYIVFNFSGITDAHFISSGGVDAGLGHSASNFAVDNLTIGSVFTPPTLAISTYSNKPAVFFPTATGTNFVLQMSTNLTSGNWVTVSNGIPISGLIITNPPANAFFRLH